MRVVTLDLWIRVPMRVVTSVAASHLKAWNRHWSIMGPECLAELQECKMQKESETQRCKKPSTLHMFTAAGCWQRQGVILLLKCGVFVLIGCEEDRPFTWCQSTSLWKQRACAQDENVERYISLGATNCTFLKPRSKLFWTKSIILKFPFYTNTLDTPNVAPLFLP